jgi:hypothetical protein
MIHGVELSGPQVVPSEDLTGHRAQSLGLWLRVVAHVFFLGFSSYRPPEIRGSLERPFLKLEEILW